MSRTRIDHIGILVADLEAAVKRFESLFGAPKMVKEMPEHGLRVAEFDTENVTVELLQYTGKNDGFARKVMGDELGLNHISAAVPDLDQSLAQLSGAGFRLMDGFPTEGAHGQVAFFHPDDATGLLFEVCQPD
jgi:methylmalonyl-CoA/ethylmalonyl-CoA epimerase